MVCRGFALIKRPPVIDDLLGPLWTGSQNLLHRWSRASWRKIRIQEQPVRKQWPATFGPGIPRPFLMTRSLLERMDHLDRCGVWKGLPRLHQGDVFQSRLVIQTHLRRPEMTIAWTSKPSPLATSGMALATRLKLASRFRFQVAKL